MLSPKSQGGNNETNQHRHLVRKPAPLADKGPEERHTKTFYSGVTGRAGQRECNAKADAWLDDGVENPNAKLSRLTAEYLENLKLTS